MDSLILDNRLHEKQEFNNDQVFCNNLTVMDLSIAVSQ